MNLKNTLTTVKIYVGKLVYGKRWMSDNFFAEESEQITEAANAAVSILKL
jgi:hypothetical protein